MWPHKNGKIANESEANDVISIQPMEPASKRYFFTYHICANFAYPLTIIHHIFLNYRSIPVQHNFLKNLFSWVFLDLIIQIS